MSPGDKMFYHQETRGGYGFINHPPVIVVRMMRKRVRVRALLPVRVEDDERSVRPEKLTPPGEPCRDEWCVKYGHRHVLEWPGESTIKALRASAEENRRKP